jgi:hypothetical protein
LERVPHGEKLPKRLPNGLGAARSQSSSSASRTVPELTIYKRGRVRREKKRRQLDLLANQIDRKVMDRQVIDGQVEDGQTGQNKADERWNRRATVI